MAIIDKRREGPNQAQVMNIIGDVQGKSALLLDDMIDTGGTIVQGAQACMEKGAREVWAGCTHGVLVRSGIGATPAILPDGSARDRFDSVARQRSTSVQN